MLGEGWPEDLPEHSCRRIEAAFAADAELREDVERLVASLHAASRRDFALAFARRLGRGVTPGRALLAAIQDALAGDDGQTTARDLLAETWRRRT